jgi:FXSXX-COOH protein
MDRAESESRAELDLDSALPDVTSLPLAAVLSTDESTLPNAVLANAVRRLREESAGGEEIVAGHGENLP